VQDGLLLLLESCLYYVGWWSSAGLPASAVRRLTKFIYVLLRNFNPTRWLWGIQLFRMVRSRRCGRAASFDIAECYFLIQLHACHFADVLCAGDSGSLSAVNLILIELQQHVSFALPTVCWCSLRLWTYSRMATNSPVWWYRALWTVGGRICFSQRWSCRTAAHREDCHGHIGFRTCLLVWRAQPVFRKGGHCGEAFS
jgi:hypothetical protein